MILLFFFLFIYFIFFYSSGLSDRIVRKQYLITGDWSRGASNEYRQNMFFIFFYEEIRKEYHRIMIPKYFLTGPLGHFRLTE